jgi:hypothetical protein
VAFQQLALLSGAGVPKDDVARGVADGEGAAVRRDAYRQRSTAMRAIIRNQRARLRTIPLPPATDALGQETVTAFAEFAQPVRTVPDDMDRYRTATMGAW